MPHNRKVRRLTIDKAREEIQDKKELGAVQHEFAEKLKRKLALQAMLNTLNVSSWHRYVLSACFSLTGTFLVLIERAWEDAAGY